jgi:energy-coupling factor transporter transmembrane protein EcfT
MHVDIGYDDRVTRSAKLGIASLLLIVASLVPAFLKPETPFTFICAWISCLLGFIAAKQGSKWWLVIPSLIIAGTALMLYVGFQAT